MDSWEKVLTEGILPEVTNDELDSVIEALERNDERLIQAGTTWPLRDTETAEACCLMAWISWQGGKGKTNIKEINEDFHQLVETANKNLGDPVAAKYFMNWFDMNRRDVVIAGCLRVCLTERERRGYKVSDVPIIV